MVITDTDYISLVYDRKGLLMYPVSTIYFLSPTGNLVSNKILLIIILVRIIMTRIIKIIIAKVIVMKK